LLQLAAACCSLPLVVGTWHFEPEQSPFAILLPSLPALLLFFPREEKKKKKKVLSLKFLYLCLTKKKKKNTFWLVNNLFKKHMSPSTSVIVVMVGHVWSPVTGVMV
jgi:hypothetical protein